MSGMLLESPKEENGSYADDVQKDTSKINFCEIQ